MNKINIKLTKKQSDNLVRYGTFAVYGLSEISEIEYSEFDYKNPFPPDFGLIWKQITIHHTSYSGKGVYEIDNITNDSFSHIFNLIKPLIRENKINTLLNE
jgi:hypothetical protein